LRRAIKIYIFPTLFIFTVSCAYFNMYYNAKESYNEAEEKRKETSQVDKALYESSLKELSKILEFYPESKWVDDALLMMGLCYLRQEDYYKAQRKFLELITNYPESGLIDEARIHLAEVEIGLKNYDEARKLIESIKTDKLGIENTELYKLNAEMSLSLGDSTEALKLLIKASDEADGNAEKIKLIESSADLAVKIRDYKAASEMYKSLSGLYTERQKIFDSTVKYAEALYKLNKADEAVKILEEITSIAEYEQYSLAGEIKLAGFYLDNKDTVKTIEKLDEILRTNPKNKDNGAALSETAYYFGEYYFNLKKDFKSAENMYDSSGFFDRRNEYFQKASNRLGLIRDFRILRKKIEMFSVQRDSLTAKIVRLTNITGSDTTKSSNVRNTNKDLDKAVKELRTLETSYVNDKMKLAEKLYFDFNLTDTAKVLFKEVSKESLFPHKASKAMLNLIVSDSALFSELEDSLLLKYPETESANYIRRKRGIEPVVIIEDSAKYLFNISSQKFLDSLYTEAMTEYFEIGMKYESSPLSAKILQAAGMIAENYLKDYAKAVEIYTALKEKHPNTAYGKFAANKLKKDGEKADEVQKTEEKIPDTDKWYMMDRRNN